MQIVRASWFWWFSFTILFLLSLDFWSWEQPVTLSWFNLPPWIFYFLGLQIAFAIALTIFAFNFWKTPRDGEGR